MGGAGECLQQWVLKNVWTQVTLGMSWMTDLARGRNHFVLERNASVSITSYLGLHRSGNVQGRQYCKARVH